MEFYESLGLEPKLSLDPDDLKNRFYERSRQWHPDRFTRASREDQQRSLDMTALLNDAFRTLRDKVARVEYFLKSNGLQLSKDAPPELLEEVFELNMAIEELRGRDELRGGDDSARTQLEQARKRFEGLRSEIDETLEGLSRRYDSSPDRAMLEEIRGELNRRRYISNLVREVEKELSGGAPHVHSAD